MLGRRQKQKMTELVIKEKKMMQPVSTANKREGRKANVIL